MKKIILVLVMGLIIVGCEESSTPAASGSTAPVASPSQPAIPAQKTITVEILTSEPTQYQIVIQRYVENVGYDSVNPVVISGTTSAASTIKTFLLQYKCRVYIYKNATNSGSTINISGYTNTTSIINMTSAYWIHEDFFNL
jgi:hypothetical protein